MIAAAERILNIHRNFLKIAIWCLRFEDRFASMFLAGDIFALPGRHRLPRPQQLVRRLVPRHAEATEIHRAAVEEGMRTLYDDGTMKALAGITTIEEVLKVTRDV